MIAILHLRQLLLLLRMPLAEEVRHRPSARQPGRAKAWRAKARRPTGIDRVPANARAASSGPLMRVHRRLWRLELHAHRQQEALHIDAGGDSWGRLHGGDS